MEKVRDLTIKDMEGIKIKGNKTRFDVLVAASERAKQILEKHEQETNMSKSSYPERKRERSSAVRNDGNGSSTATAAVGKRKNKFKVVMGNGPQPPPPLPQEFKNAIQVLAQGRSISQQRLVIQKGLFDTDVSKNHNRLSIPLSKINDDFLTEEEKYRLRTPDKNDENSKRDYIEANIIEPSLKRDTVRFGKWDMPKKTGKISSCYVINGNWKHIVKRNKLTGGMVVQLWSFRVDRDLCFALVRLSKNKRKNTS